MADSDYPDLHAVQERLLAWFAVHGRDLPWRHTRDPYAILVAEIMLQQTGVERVRPKYEAWLARLPTLKGIGRYPAGAVACFAYEQDVTFVDTNIRRVLGRIFLGPAGDSPSLPEKGLHELAEQVLPRGRAWAWHQALMDF